MSIDAARGMWTSGRARSAVAARLGRRARAGRRSALALLAGALALAGCGDAVDLSSGTLSLEEADARLSQHLERVSWREARVTGVSDFEPLISDLAETLPPITEYRLAASPSVSGAVVAEVFSSTEKAGEGVDGWMTEAARAFNASGARTPSGRPAQIALRAIPSGKGYQYIASGKHTPAGFTPSNALWVRMAEARGVTMTPIAERTVANVAGVVMKTGTADTLRNEGLLSVEGMIDGVVQNKFKVGYTNPYASSTGLNFLATTLTRFAGDDPSRMLAPEAVSAFEAFQTNVPFVAFTTLQLRSNVQRDGSLDAFVMEWQTFTNSAELSSGYEFEPFGWPHDNPLYAVGAVDAERRAVLERFAAFLASPAQQRAATRLGFNPSLSAPNAGPMPAGEPLLRAQKIWKEKKDAGRPIAAVFVADVSGSMEGGRLRALKRALIDGSGFIAPTNAIGLIEFSDQPRVLLPIEPFSLLHVSAFQTAAKRMQAGGGTAMYDAVALGLRMLRDHQAANPDVVPKLFVLTDGATNEGMVYEDMSEVIAGLRIPVNTIGFEADLPELQRLSATVEAASIAASEANVRNKIGEMFNHDM